MLGDVTGVQANPSIGHATNTISHYVGGFEHYQFSMSALTTELTAHLCIPPKLGHMISAAPQTVASLYDAGSMIQAAVAQPRSFQVSPIPLHSLQLLLQVLILRGRRSQLGFQDSLRQQHISTSGCFCAQKGSRPDPCQCGLLLCVTSHNRAERPQSTAHAPPEGVESCRALH